MAQFREWTEFEGPWVYGAIVFTTWILTAALIGVVFGESIAEAVDVSTLVGALAFAAVTIYLKHRSTRRSASN